MVAVSATFACFGKASCSCEHRVKGEKVGVHQSPLHALENHPNFGFLHMSQAPEVCNGLAALLY